MSTATIPVRMSATTHRELRYVATMLSMQLHQTITLGHLIDLAWDALKQERPDIVALLQRSTE